MNNPSDRNFIRKYPYPYKAMFAICSDLDETPDAFIYHEIIKYLNTDMNTHLGKGVNLEVGNTIYFDMPEGHYSYNNTSEDDRKKIRKYIRSGLIDCFHSYGDNVTKREVIKDILQHLSSHKCIIRTWVDHAQAISNIGSDIMEGEGDLKTADVYHSDLTIDYGVRYFWLGRVSSIAGQNTRRSYAPVFNVRHVIESFKTILKDSIKNILAFFCNQKYRLHAKNRLYTYRKLRDGSKVLEFIRFDSYYGGVGRKATASGVSEIITEKMLNHLISTGGISIFYTHLGKINTYEEPFTKSTRKSLKLLSDKFHDKQILVATTTRLLDYVTMRDSVKVQQLIDGNKQIFNVFADCVSKLGGLTLYCENTREVVVRVNGEDVTFIENDIDETGRYSVSIDWNKLEYPG